MMQAIPPSTPTEAAALDEATVRQWVTAWGAEVAAVDLETAKARFSPDVVGFGTYADIVHGIDELHGQQWSNIWPTITGFAFRTDELVTLVSADRCQAVAVVAWDSTGVDAEGLPFPRPGRATIVLTRSSVDDAWLGVHTHFSLVP